MTISDWLNEISVKFDELGFVPTTLTDEKREHFVEWFATEISEIKKEEERLKAELKARLKRAVELPVSVEDLVYDISDLRVQELTIKYIYIEDFGVSKNWMISCAQTTKEDFVNLAGNVYGITWFTTKAEAEARLAKLRGEK